MPLVNSLLARSCDHAYIMLLLVHSFAVLPRSCLRYFLRRHAHKTKTNRCHSFMPVLLPPRSTMKRRAGRTLTPQGARHRFHCSLFLSTARRLATSFIIMHDYLQT